MPTRIKPNRVGYSGYTCVGISRPCIDPMDGDNNKFNCLPKTSTRVSTNEVYNHLAPVAEDEALQAALATTDTHYDPLNEGVFIDLYGAFVRAGFEDLIDVTCEYEYTCNEPTGLPPEAQSKRQVNVSIGFLDPPSTNMDAIGVFVAQDVEESSNGSGTTSCSGIAVTVVTALDVASGMLLKYKDRVIYVDCAEDESDWKLVPGWEVTECP